MKRIVLLLSCVAAVLCATAQNTFNVAVMCINDFHGAFVRDDARGVPGAAAVVQTLDSLKQRYPAHIVVSAGDNFGGSYFYQSTRSKTLMPQFFQDCGITLSGVGNHEFDEGQDKLLDAWRTGVECRPASWSIEYVSANIRLENSTPGSGKSYTQPQFCLPYSVRQVALPDGRSFSLAFVGMTTSSTPRQTSSSKVRGLSFDGRVSAVIDSLRHTPGYAEVEKAHARILLTHQGTSMRAVMRGDILMQVPEWDDADSLSLSQFNDPSFCAILTSHSHKAVRGYINDNPAYPVLQGMSHGRCISMMVLTVDASTLEVLGVTPYLIPTNTHLTLSPKARRLEAQVEEQLNNTRTKGGASLGERLTFAKEDIAFNRSLMKHDLTRMGRLVSESYAEALRHALSEAAVMDDDQLKTTPIVGVTHIGGVREGFQKGPVTVMNVGEALPFDNALRVFRVTGKQLRALIDFGLHNERYGYLQYAYLTPKMNKKGQVKSLTYRTPDGKTYPITDQTICYFAADEFLSNGGDGYDVSLFPVEREVKDIALPHITDAFIDYLRTKTEL